MGRVTPENEKASRANFGEKNGFYGKHHSEETKKIISENNSIKLKGKKKTNEHKQKLSAAASRRWAAYRERKASGQEKSL